MYGLQIMRVVLNVAEMTGLCGKTAQSDWPRGSDNYAVGRRKWFPRTGS